MKLIFFLSFFFLISLSFSKKDGLGFKPGDVFEFFPLYVDTVIPNGKLIQFSSPCFKNTTAVATKTSNTRYTIKLTHEDSANLTCKDGYLFGTMENLQVHYVFFHGQTTINWDGNFTSDDEYDIEKNGIRIFRFLDGEVKTIADVWETFQLFFGALLGKTVPPFTAKDNLEFMKEWINITMPKRPINFVNISKSLVHSGDFFGVIRLDGLDPMLAYGMGSRTGHTTIAMWMEGELYICESTVNSNYWPTNGIQRTPFDQWMKQAMEAHYNVVWLPLSDESASKFDVNGAIDFFKRTEGLPYGFNNMFFCWIDTLADNTPFPLTMELFTVVIPNALHIMKLDATLDVATQALNHRLGTSNLTIRQSYAEATRRGISLAELYTIPEQDNWNYTFSDGRTGPSMVCDVFVTHMWKAGGLFGNISNQIQATEFTNFDAYSLKIFNSSFVRPKECQIADPDLPYCQVMGEYRMDMVGWNTAVPFPHMREKCPTIPPNYIRPANC
eukprot:TRINITY_DN2685_c0_g1_i1.p1 TRINITY_DN2685_c0_g1~~TRINITY_DN2685_c0_g1_i1.p1  ORF type:complete len:499 (+),score=112.43 TRINITY_DN2685_c0_g1_i1:11-1507(+)